MRHLTALGYDNIVAISSSELDLRDSYQVKSFFEKEQPDYVFVAAAKVGGIMANNTYRAEFLYDNLIHNAYLSGVRKLLFLGSSCIYPKMAPQPLKEEYLLTGTLEPTNEPYAIAKIAGIKLCDAYRAQYGCNFISAMPTNLYGPNDNYDLKNSHVLPALIRKCVEARKQGSSEVEIWGTGNPRREFMHVDDLAEASLFLMAHFNEPGFINVGTGSDVTIRELAEIIKTHVGFEGSLNFDVSKPDGTPRKLMDVSKMDQLGWRHRIPLEEGIERTVQEYTSSISV